MTHVHLRAMLCLVVTSCFPSWMHGRPKVSHAVRGNSSGIQGTHSFRFPKYRWLESGAAEGRCASREMVGDFQRSSIECTGREGGVSQTKVSRRLRQAFWQRALWSRKPDRSFSLQYRPIHPLPSNDRRPHYPKRQVPQPLAPEQVLHLPRLVHLLTIPSRSMRPGNRACSAVSGTRSKRLPQEPRPALQISRIRASLCRPRSPQITFQLRGQDTLKQLSWIRLWPLTKSLSI